MKCSKQRRISTYFFHGSILLFLLILILSCRVTSTEDSPTLQVPSVVSEDQPEIVEVSPQAVLIPQKENNLSKTGHWILLSSESGLWGMNSDGSGLTRFTNSPLIAPVDLRLGYSNRYSQFAFITSAAASTTQGLTLSILDIPEGTIQVVTRLTTSASEPQASAELCDPKTEAARAVSMGSALQWSPDGSELAFIGIMEGPSSDIYTFNPASSTLLRISDESNQAYDLHWHWVPESQTIVYATASCFGTGAGFNSTGVWKTQTDTRTPSLLVQPDSQSYGEKFITWAGSGRETFFMASYSGCPLRDLRMVEIDSQSDTLIYKGCFDDFAIGPTGSFGILVSRDFSEKPGLYIYNEPEIAGIPAVFVPEDQGRELEYSTAAYYYSSIGETNSEVRSVNYDGTPGWYTGTGSIPAVSRDEKNWVWNDKEAFYFQNQFLEQPVRLCETEGVQPYWYEDVDAEGVIHQRLIYSCGENRRDLYMISSPDFSPSLISADIQLLAAPYEIFSN